MWYVVMGSTLVHPSGRDLIDFSQFDTNNWNMHYRLVFPTFQSNSDQNEVILQVTIYIL